MEINIPGLFRDLAYDDKILFNYCLTAGLIVGLSAFSPFTVSSVKLASWFWWVVGITIICW